MKVAAVVVLAALAAPSAAQAHPQGQGRTLREATAKRAIIRTEGPGTVVGSCRRLSARVFRCGYTTPALNVGIESEEPGAVFVGTDDVRAIRHGVRVRTALAQ